VANNPTIARLAAVSGRFAFLEETELERVGSVDQVARMLRGMIADGHLVQGERLPEVPLSKAIGVSRNTLRDAIRVLGAEGLVTHELHRGAVVRVLSSQDIREIYEIRRSLELSALAAIAQDDPVALPRLKETLVACEGAFDKGDYTAFVEHELEFHAAIVANLDNSRLDEFFARVLGELRLLFSKLSSDSEPKANKALLSFYRDLFAATENGEHARAQEMLGEHLDRYERRLSSLVAADQH
jgi:DNA-binding GntR family transcriptional regulator